MNSYQCTKTKEDCVWEILEIRKLPVLVEKRVKFGKEVQGEIWSLNVHQWEMREKAGSNPVINEVLVAENHQLVCSLSLMLLRCLGTEEQNCNRRGDPNCKCYIETQKGEVNEVFQKVD